ncbi:MAG: hypothetical protein KA257_07765 [Opitutaceae bacterium]|nr:hypothetical protein [Opitutaceae bacterium]MBP9912627.1 hypothetical protein [Opitutaceae bacterium]
MKTLLWLGLLSGVVLTTGCDTLSTGSSGPFVAVAPQVRSFESDQKTVFFAAQVALKRMDFTLTKALMAQGRVEAQSGLRDTAVFGAARQFTVRIKLDGSDAGPTEVAVLFHEQSEADFKVGATNRALGQHGLYDSFFDQLEQALRQKPARMDSTGN